MSLGEPTSEKLERPRFTDIQTHARRGSILGMLVGAWLGLQHFGAHVGQQLAENPDAAVCGTPALAAMGLGAVGGVLAGAVVGMSVSRLRRGDKPPPDRPKSGPRKDL